MQYFKLIEAVAASQGFEQILPSAARTGPRRGALQIPKREPSPVPMIIGVKLLGDKKIMNGDREEKAEPSIYSPQPLTSTLLSAPATDYPVRSVTPELVLDRMSSRIVSSH